MTEQPAAPYLDAVIGYGTRGPGRFHVPGHKGGQGADPGLRFGLGDRALWLDIPQDIWGVDLGPSPTPYEEAERLAAEAHLAECGWCEKRYRFEVSLRQYVRSAADEAMPPQLKAKLSALRTPLF